MRMAKKVSLTVVFAVGVLDVFFDIFRTVYTVSSVGVQNLWEILEVTIAVMLSALVAYRQVFSLGEKMSSAAASRERLKGHQPGGDTFDSVQSNTARNRGYKGDTWMELDSMERLNHPPGNGVGKSATQGGD